MLKRITRLFCLALLVLGTGACGAFDFQSQELALKHDLEGDSFELELIYRGVERGRQPVPEGGDPYSPAPFTTRDVERGLEALQRIAQGQRYFMLFESSVAVDLDEIEERLGTELEKEEPDNLASAALRLAKGIEVLEAQVFLDDDERVAVRQVIRINNARQALALLNSYLHGATRRGAESGDFKTGSAKFFDDETRAAFLADAQAGRTWVTLSGAEIVLDLPLTPASVAGSMKMVVQEEVAMQAKAHSPEMALLNLIQEIEAADGRLKLTFGADDGGAWRIFLGEDAAEEYNSSLLDSLRVHGFEFAPDPTAKD
ncbi:MAG: hypothetical protein ACI8X5_003103 [Planctomycetota bacterium]|jgi:hypothetical protein